MYILAHRGMWGGDIKPNSTEALKKAIEEGFGFESDVRDYQGNLVISHDIPGGDNPNVEDIFEIMASAKDDPWFAVNIKADGLKIKLKNLIRKYGIEHYFLFDMSVPQMVEFRDYGLKFFTRQSEYEMNPCMYDYADGVWIDGFTGTKWINRELIQGHLDAGKRVCIVSPELHGDNNHKTFWEKLNGFDLLSHTKDRIMLCTDQPQEARDFFS